MNPEIIPIVTPHRPTTEELLLRCRRFKRMAREIARLIPGEDADSDRLCVRASGECECSICGLKYFDHPVCSDGVLHVACDGSLLKL